MDVNQLKRPINRQRNRNQETASIYVPPALRRCNISDEGRKKKDIFPSDCCETVNRLCLKKGITKPEIKKCDNSYLLFDEDNITWTTSLSQRLRNTNMKENAIDSSIENLKNESTGSCSRRSCQGKNICNLSNNSENSNFPDRLSCESSGTESQIDKNINVQILSNVPHLEEKLNVAKKSETVKSRKQSVSPKTSVIPSLKKCNNSSLLFEDDVKKVNHSTQMLSTNVFEPLHKEISHENKSKLLVASEVFDKVLSDEKDGIKLNPCLMPDNVPVVDCKQTCQDQKLLVDMKDNETSLPISQIENYETIEDYAIAIYDFPQSFKTQDLMAVFSVYIADGFYIKWVDDTHAIGVFPNPFLVADALKKSSSFSLLKVSSLTEANEKTREVANSIPIPNVPRPKTCPSLARRLVGGALGLRVPVSDETKKAEKKILQDAKEERRIAARQREEAWEGTLRSNLG